MNESAMSEFTTSLDSMRWFSHWRRTGRGRRLRGRLPNKMPHFFVFICPWWPWPSTLTFELGRDFCTLHVTAKFHYPMFNRTEVIVLTNKQTPLKTSTSLRYAVPVVKYFTRLSTVEWFFTTKFTVKFFDGKQIKIRHYLTKIHQKNWDQFLTHNVQHVTSQTPVYWTLWHHGE